MLPGEEPELNPALRPVLARLGVDQQTGFRAELARFAHSYPQQAFGRVLPFRRIFTAGQRSRSNNGGCSLDRRRPRNATVWKDPMEGNR